MHDRLDAAGAALFWEQSPADQRHAFEVARRVADALPGNGEAFAAALLHDVGKRHAGLGAIGRSLATVLSALRVPMTASMRRYRDHGPVGAADLTAAGYDGVVVAFAEHHPAPVPDGVDAVVWNVLLEADGGVSSPVGGGGSGASR